MDLIRLRNINKTYKNGVTAIYDMDLTIKKGEFVFLIGETGCGKTYLIKMLSLIYGQNDNFIIT